MLNSIPTKLVLLSFVFLACKPTVPPVPTTPSIQRHGLASELRTQGSVVERQSAQDADLAIFYSGEHQGSMETCGCPKRPRGSLPRMKTYLNQHAVSHPQTATLLVNGGWWLSDAMGADGALRADAALMNTSLIAALDEAFDLHAANVSYLDLPGLQGQTVPEWAVSANVQTIDPTQSPIAVSRIVRTGDLRVGITGITKVDQSFVPSPAFEISDPVEPAIQALQAMRSQSDVLVLLVYDAPEAAKSIAARVPDLDVIVDTRQNRQHGAPIQIGETLWVKSHYQTMRLGELRLKVSPKTGKAALVVDRKIDMDPAIEDEEQLKKRMKTARIEIDALQSELFGLSE
jgi:2',3'-cyclic-nucleotide 2'-phosphodiesterase (5'-nucleotidase family)